MRSGQETPEHLQIAGDDQYRSPLLFHTLYFHQSGHGRRIDARFSTYGPKFSCRFDQTDHSQHVSAVCRGSHFHWRSQRLISVPGTVRVYFGRVTGHTIGNSCFWRWSKVKLRMPSNLLGTSLRRCILDGFHYVAFCRGIPAAA